MNELKYWNNVQVGDFCGIQMFTDRHNATVTSIKKNKKGNVTHIGIKRNIAKVVKGSCQDGSAEYEYITDPDANEIIFRHRKNSLYVKVGNGLNDKPYLTPHYHEYFDPSF